eukprot:TRINITY_DN64515_c0_g1_i1.p1 TRINITY_DN64515_c0_g1~~TRINITY_DN64515_c0_g1_i1.p1  ORF type:complete len:501 (-),score=120.67 TRINITY_DN64515_c0_g1_i1:65-1519(-)
MSRIRPWNIFKKTLYAGHGAEGGAGSGSLQLPAQISLARARLREDADAEVSSFTANLTWLLPPAAALWLLLCAARWHGSDAERLKALEKKGGGPILLDFLGCRLASHLGPYQLPNFVQARLYEEPLRRLREPLLLDHERSASLSRLEQMTQRRLAALQLTLPPPEAAAAAAASSGAAGADLHPAVAAIEPLLRTIFAAPAKQDAGSSSSSQTGDQAAAAASAMEASMLGSSTHRTVETRIVFDVLGALAPEERVVPSWVLSGLVQSTQSPWSYGARGDEVRANMLVQLLASSENCKRAVQLPEVCEYLQRIGTKVQEETNWPLKSYLLSGETPDLLRRGALLVCRQCPNALAVQPRRPRDTPSLQVKHDLRNLWTTTLVTLGWAGLRAWRGQLDANSIIAMAKACGGALAGMGLLETVWRAEEAVIQSPWYFESGGASMLGASAGMAALNCVVGAWAFRYATFIPFVACRVKDEVTDAYRHFDP